MPVGVVASMLLFRSKRKRNTPLSSVNPASPSVGGMVVVTEPCSYLVNTSAQLCSLLVKREASWLNFLSTHTCQFHGLNIPRLCGYASSPFLFFFFGQRQNESVGLV